MRTLTHGHDGALIGLWSYLLAKLDILLQLPIGQTLLTHARVLRPAIPFSFDWNLATLPALVLSASALSELSPETKIMFTFIFPSHLHSTLLVLLPDLLFFNEFLNYTFGIDFKGGNLTLALSAKLPLTTPLRHVRRGQSRSIVPSVKYIPGHILLHPQPSKYKTTT